MENIYVQFDGIVYQQIVGIPNGTNCVPFILLREGFYVKPPETQTVCPIEKYCYTFRYLGDLFTIDNLEFAEHIPDIYPRELQLNKANTSDKETSFLDLNIKVLVVIVYDKRDECWFPIVNFPLLSVDVPRFHHVVSIFRS